jgi:AcrR family transcriptional regulator
MAKRPGRRGSSGGQGGDGAEPGAASPRDAAIDALMALLAERDFGGVGLDDIATRAGLSLSGLRAAFPGKFAILAAFNQRIDLAVLAGGPAEGDSERDRLFDVMMRRVDALLPYRAALKRLARAAQWNPTLACASAMVSDRSMSWMLAAAGVKHGGFLGRIAKSGAAMVFAEAMAAWLAGDAPDEEKTMAALDRALRRGETAMTYIRDACELVTTFGRRAREAMTGREATG